MLPDDEALGLNAFDISLGVNTSARPNFRAFSTGGQDQANNTIRIDPDLELEANGGFNPNSNPPGASTYGLDNSVYMGSMDLVTRVSRVYSLWFEATGISGEPEFSPPVVEPRIEQQPLGTGLEIAFRGASIVGRKGTTVPWGTPTHSTDTAITTPSRTLPTAGTPGKRTPGSPSPGTRTGTRTSVIWMGRTTTRFA